MNTSAELAKKLADTFEVALDFLVDNTTGKTTEIRDKPRMKKRLSGKGNHSKNIKNGVQNTEIKVVK